MRFTCKFGHTEVRRGKLVPMVHKSRESCAIYVQLRAQGKIDVFGNPARGWVPGATPPMSPEAPGNSGGASPEPATEGGAVSSAASAPSSEPASEKKPSLGERIKRGISIAYEKATVTPPAPPGLDAGEADWEVTPETSVRFFVFIKSAASQVGGLVTSFFEIPDFPKEIWEVDPGEEYVFRTTMRGFVTNVMKKVFRAKSPEQADRIVSGLTGLLGFGLMFFKIGIHLAVNLPKSPKLKKFYAARAEAQAAREVAKADAEAKKQAEALAAANARPRPAAGVTAAA